MIRVYYLKTKIAENTETVEGIDYIHNSILEVEDALRKLIQNTTTAEHNGLVAVAESWRESTAEEQAQWEEFRLRYPTLEPTPDYLRACELLSQSPPTITMPHVWELLRIIGKELGYRFEE